MTVRLAAVDWSEANRPSSSSSSSSWGGTADIVQVNNNNDGGDVERGGRLNHPRRLNNTHATAAAATRRGVVARSSSSSVPLSSSSSSGDDVVPVKGEPNGDDGGGGPGPQEVVDDGEPRSSTLRRMGITNGLLGVSQERVEKVMKQALPVMGGMASQNVLNLADSVMVGRLGTACVAAVAGASVVVCGQHTKKLLTRLNSSVVSSLSPPMADRV